MRHKQIICTKTLTRSKRKKSCLIKEAELRSVGCCCMHFVSVKLKCYPASFRSSVHIWFLHLLKTLLNNAPASQSSQMVSPEIKFLGSSFPSITSGRWRPILPLTGRRNHWVSSMLTADESRRKSRGNIQYGTHTSLSSSILQGVPWRISLSVLSKVPCEDSNQQWTHLPKSIKCIFSNGNRLPPLLFETLSDCGTGQNVSLFPTRHVWALSLTLHRLMAPHIFWIGVY